MIQPSLRQASTDTTTGGLFCIQVPLGQTQDCGFGTARKLCAMSAKLLYMSCEGLFVFCFSIYISVGPVSWLLGYSKSSTDQDQTQTTAPKQRRIKQTKNNGRRRTAHHTLPEAGIFNREYFVIFELLLRNTVPTLRQETEIFVSVLFFI